LTTLALTPQEHLGVLANGETKVVAYTPAPPFRGFSVSCGSNEDVLHFSLRAPAALQAYVVDTATMRVVMHASGAAAEQVVFACPSVGTFDLAFQPLNPQATSIAVGLSTTRGAPNARDAGNDAADAADARDAAAPGDAGRVGFSPPELYTTGVPVNFACTASYDGPAVFGATEYERGPYVLPSSFNLSANVKLIPSTIPSSTWLVQTVFTPVTPESRSYEVRLSFEALTERNGANPGSQSPMSSVDGTTISGWAQSGSMASPCSVSAQFKQTSASHFSMSAGGYCIYKGLYRGALIGHWQRMGCSATY
jgi:hypothetical protein